MVDGPDDEYPDSDVGRGNVDDELQKTDAELAKIRGDLAAGRTTMHAATSRIPDLESRKSRLKERKMLSGCSGPALGMIIVAIVLTLIGAVVVSNKGDDDSAKCTALGVGTGEAALPRQDCPSDEEADGGTPSTGDGSDVSAYAGHYVLTEGLDSPNGQDTQPLDPAAWDISVNPSTGSFDVDESGTITGGDIHTSFVGVGDPGECTWTLDGDQASGSLALAGTGASGQLTYTGEVTIEGPCSTGSALPATRIITLGIVGNDVVLCYVAMAPDLTSCSANDPGVAGRFTRE